MLYACVPVHTTCVLTHHLHVHIHTFTSCVYIHTFICFTVYLCIYSGIHMCVCICTCQYWSKTCMYTHICMCIHLHMLMFTHSVCTCSCISMHTHKYVHAHMHVQPFTHLDSEESGVIICEFKLLIMSVFAAWQLSDPPHSQASVSLSVE